MADQHVNPTSGTPGSRRPYRSAARARQADGTRGRILEAAEQLFLERGYRGTTTKAIASAAGVVEKTVFLTFPSKAALLSEVIRVAVRGDQPGERVVDSGAWQAMLAAPTEELLSRFAALMTPPLLRTARIVMVAEAAASGDAELSARRDLGHESIRATVGSVVDELSARGALDARWPAERAKDVLFALTSEATFLRLTAECGWTTDEYSAWLADTARATLMRA